MAYLNELVGRKVRDHRGIILGKLVDLLISSGERNGCPPVIALALVPDGKSDLLLIRWTGNEDLAGNKIVLEQREIQPYLPSGNEIYLARDLLDKQVIDTENYHVARVNDLELGKIGEEYHLINLVIDGGGFLRRLGLGAFAERITATIHRPLQRRAVAWGDLNFLPPTGIQVKLPREKFNELHPADIAELLENVGPRIGAQMLEQMEDEKIADTLEELEPDFQAEMLEAFPNERAADIIEEMQPDQAADMLQDFDEQRRTQLFNLMEPEKRAEVAELLEYPEDTAGGLMTTKYASVSPGSTVAEALQELRRSRAASEAEMIYYVYVLDAEEHLLGVVSLGDLVLAASVVSLNKIMHHKPIRALVDASREEVMEVMTRYNLLALPVVDGENRLQGIITADHLHEMIESENTEDMLRMAGSDAEEMEQRSPIRTAFLRLPWIMATMFIELGAGLVIHLYNATLARVLLLASFMPIISAISGNTGLQSATIVVRGIATNHVQLTKWRQALLRQVTMTLLLGSATGLTLGVIGAVWYGKWTFGLVVTIGMFAAVNIAGVVGTIVPLLSKRLGFDPAITSGPFETAFQDVVGISIYLTLATLLIRYLVK
jgi:magnesium transporter